MSKYSVLPLLSAISFGITACFFLVHTGTWTGRDLGYVTVPLVGGIFSGLGAIIAPIEELISLKKRG